MSIITVTDEVPHDGRADLLLTLKLNPSPVLAAALKEAEGALLLDHMDTLHKMRQIEKRRSYYWGVRYWVEESARHGRQAAWGRVYCQAKVNTGLAYSRPVCLTPWSACSWTG